MHDRGKSNYIECQSLYAIASTVQFPEVGKIVWESSLLNPPPVGQRSLISRHVIPPCFPPCLRWVGWGILLIGALFSRLLSECIIPMTKKKSLLKFDSPPTIIQYDDIMVL